MNKLKIAVILTFIMFQTSCANLQEQVKATFSSVKDFLTVTTDENDKFIYFNG